MYESPPPTSTRLPLLQALSSCAAPRTLLVPHGDDGQLSGPDLARLAEGFSAGPQVPASGNGGVVFLLAAAGATPGGSPMVGVVAAQRSTIVPVQHSAVQCPAVG